MKRCALLILTLAVALPLAAETHLDLILDLEGVHRAGDTPRVAGESGVFYQPSFDNGGGVGGGVNWWISGRTSLEVKVAGLATKTKVLVIGEDFVNEADLGTSQIYPIMGVVQWHPFEHGSIRPYIGAGAAYTILRNLEGSNGIPPVEFGDPWGLVVDGGINVTMSKRWGFIGDARYIPIETHGSVRFGAGPGVTATSIKVKPLLVSFGAVYHF